MTEAVAAIKGKQLDGRYTLIDKLGAGGQGEVWRAHDGTRGIDVALKVVYSREHPDTAWSALEHEYAIASRLDHPSILKVFPPHRTAEAMVLPMELASGGDLRRLRGAGFLEIIPVLLEIAQALEHAHERGVVHRDLKPGNVLFDARGRARLADFGVAESALTQPESSPPSSSTGNRDTNRHGFSPFTASPAQLRDEPPTPADDVYGLGALAYELLSGYPPYYPHFDKQRAIEEPVPPLVPTRQIPPLLGSLVTRMLAKDPLRRPRSMREVIDDLDAALNSTLTFDFESFSRMRDSGSTSGPGPLGTTTTENTTVYLPRAPDWSPASGVERRSIPDRRAKPRDGSGAMRIREPKLASDFASPASSALAQTTGGAIKPNVGGAASPPTAKPSVDATRSPAAGKPSFGTTKLPGAADPSVDATRALPTPNSSMDATRPLTPPNQSTDATRPLTPPNQSTDATRALPTPNPSMGATPPPLAPSLSSDTTRSLAAANQRVDTSGSGRHPRPSSEALARIDAALQRAAALSPPSRVDELSQADAGLRAENPTREEELTRSTDGQTRAEDTVVMPDWTSHSFPRRQHINVAWGDVTLDNLPRVARLQPIKPRRWPWVMLGLAAGAAAAVYFWLPRFDARTLPSDLAKLIAPIEAALTPDRPTADAASSAGSSQSPAASTAESAAPPTAATPSVTASNATAALGAPPSGTAPSDATDAQRLRETRAAFDRKLAILESRGAGAWGGRDFALAKTRAAESVGASDAGNPRVAEERLAAAMKLLDKVEGKAPQALADQIAAGQKALGTGQQEVAGQAFGLAHRIDPSDKRSADGQQRAQNLNAVLPLLADAQNAEHAHDYARAAQDYSQAVSIDPDNEAAKTGQARAEAAFGDDGYAKAVGSGFAALGAGRLDEARAAFVRARALKPRGAEAADGLKRVAAAQNAQRYASLRQRAAGLEAQERWQDAEEIYQDVLRADPSLAFAQEGRARAASRADLDIRLQQLIDRPDRLSAPGVRDDARALLETARAQNPQGPILQSQITRLQALLVRDEKPVAAR